MRSCGKLLLWVLVSSVCVIEVVNVFGVLYFLWGYSFWVSVLWSVELWVLWVVFFRWSQQFSHRSQIKPILQIFLVLLDHLGNLLFQLFLLFILSLNQLLKGLVVIFLVLYWKLLLKLFSFLVQIFVEFLFLCAISVTPDHKWLSHQFLHFIIEIFLARIF